MLKTIPPNSWDFGEDPVALVKLSSRGLLGSDRKLLEKRAGEEFVHKVMQNVKLADGETPVHLIALGATETFGSNRNGDGFSDKELEKQSHTFEKHAKFYRHHKNKDPKKSYGEVKLAFYNKPMRRTELLVALNRTKEAANKNGGLVADDEHQMLEAGKSLPVSMAARVPHDICDACGNHAPSRQDYCKSAEEGGKCSLFGCHSGLTKVAEDGRIQFVHNPEPVFFDISRVGRNADPIAWGELATYLQKAASIDDHVPGGAELAELAGVVPPLELALRDISEMRVAEQVKLAYHLASVEDELEASQFASRLDQACALAFSPAVQPPLDLAPLGKVGSHQFTAGLAALAEQQVLLSPRDFVRLFAGREKDASLADRVVGCLPGIYNRLLASGNLGDSIRRAPFSTSQGLSTANQREWAKKCASTHSLAPDRVQLRSSLAAIRGQVIPWNKTQSRSASDLTAQKLAGAYALYKLAFLQHQTRNMLLTSELVVRQNYIK